mmetsp:Transcript_30753/g.100094  ORF Transcript_30753/g.100094 Transcript_30753/m.100094 type:complete len:231 (-) Transcript_30753:586-1278(-)
MTQIQSSLGSLSYIDTVLGVWGPHLRAHRRRLRRLALRLELPKALLHPRQERRKVAVEFDVRVRRHRRLDERRHLERRHVRRPLVVHHERQERPHGAEAHLFVVLVLLRAGDEEVEAVLLHAEALRHGPAEEVGGPERGCGRLLARGIVARAFDHLEQEGGEAPAVHEVGALAVHHRRREGEKVLQEGASRRHQRAVLRVAAHRAVPSLEAPALEHEVALARVFADAQQR